MHSVIVQKLICLVPTIGSELAKSGKPKKELLMKSFDRIQGVSKCARAENSHFPTPLPPPAEFIRCIGNAQGPERMRECPEELRKSALFIVNANGASLLLAASFGGQGSSKQKGTVEIGPRWKQGDQAVGVPGWWDGRREAPCTQQEVSLRVGDFEARGHPAAPRGHIPKGAESGSRASVSAHSLSETL